MNDVLAGGLLTLLGVLTGLLINLLRDHRSVEATKAAKRWDVEYDSLRQLGDLLPTFRWTSEPPDDIESRKLLGVALAQRVRDDRASAAVEKLVVQVNGSHEWQDEIGNAVRVVGSVMREL